VGGVAPVAGVTFTVTNSVNGTNKDVVTDANGDAAWTTFRSARSMATATSWRPLPAGYHAVDANQDYTVVEGSCVTRFRSSTTSR
jgi:hypothetical protein